MVIISQNSIKLGCSGGQGKRVQVIRITGNQDAGYQETRKSGRITLITRYSDNHCLVTRYPDAHYDYAKQSQFQKSQMDVRLVITKDYEKKSKRTFGENKPNQSQFTFYR